MIHDKHDEADGRIRFAKVTATLRIERRGYLGRIPGLGWWSTAALTPLVLCAAGGLHPGDEPLQISSHPGIPHHARVPEGA